MSVARNRDWGERGPLPEDGVIVGSDAEARAVVIDARRRHAPIPPIGLTGGDLCTSLGGRGDVKRLRSSDAVRVQIDLGEVLIDGRLTWFVAHLIARSRLWRGRVVAVMNADQYGGWNVAPRAHPGDGRFDVLDGSLGLADRLKARRRLRTGTHVPHPAIAQTRAGAVSFAFETATGIHLDGELVGRARTVAVRIEPEVLQVFV